MASITLLTFRKRECIEAQEAAVPVKVTRSGTPYVDSAVAAISPQTLRNLVRRRQSAEKVTPD